MNEQKPKTHRTLCSKCHAEIDFNKDDILTAGDFTGAFPEMYVSSIRCPYCGERTIIAHKDMDGKVTKMEVKRI